MSQGQVTCNVEDGGILCIHVCLANPDPNVIARGIAMLQGLQGVPNPSPAPAPGPTPANAQRR